MYFWNSSTVAAQNTNVPLLLRLCRSISLYFKVKVEYLYLYLCTPVAIDQSIDRSIAIDHLPPETYCFYMHTLVAVL